MALFGSDEKETPQFTKPVEPNWVRTPEGGFLHLLSLDPEELGLGNVGGVYLIWHGGVKPEWVYTGHTKDLAAALHQAGNNSEINYYDKNGSLFVAWAPVKEPYRPGVVKYIQDSFKTLIPNPEGFTAKTVPVPVLPPVVKKKKGFLR